MLDELGGEADGAFDGIGEVKEAAVDSLDGYDVEVVFGGSNVVEETDGMF